MASVMHLASAENQGPINPGLATLLARQRDILRVSIVFSRWISGSGWTAECRTSSAWLRFYPNRCWEGALSDAVDDDYGKESRAVGPMRALRKS